MQASGTLNPLSPFTTEMDTKNGAGRKSASWRNIS
jgi:hypothetical protein